MSNLLKAINRNVQLKELQDMFRAEVGEDFAEATEHQSNCRCDKCLDWWAKMGWEDEETETSPSSPFSKEEIQAAMDKLDAE